MPCPCGTNPVPWADWPISGTNLAVSARFSTTWDWVHCGSNFKGALYVVWIANFWQVVTLAFYIALLSQESILTTGIVFNMSSCKLALL